MPVFLVPGNYAGATLEDLLRAVEKHNRMLNKGHYVQERTANRIFIVCAHGKHMCAFRAVASTFGNGQGITVTHFFQHDCHALEAEVMREMNIKNEPNGNVGKKRTLPNPAADAGTAISGLAAEGETNNNAGNKRARVGLFSNTREGDKLRKSIKNVEGEFLRVSAELRASNTRLSTCETALKNANARLATYEKQLAWAEVHIEAQSSELRSLKTCVTQLMGAAAIPSADTAKLTKTHAAATAKKKAPDTKPSADTAKRKAPPGRAAPGTTQKNKKAEVPQP